MAGNVHVEAEVLGPLARGAQCAPMGLAHVNGVVAALVQQVYERPTDKSTVHPSLNSLNNPIHVPIGCCHQIVFHIGRFVAAQRPVGHAVASRVGSRHERTAAGRTDGRGVGLREQHSLAGQPLHIGCLVGVVQRCALRPEGHRCVLPSHVVHHKENDVRTVAGRCCCYCHRC